MKPGGGVQGRSSFLRIMNSTSAGIPQEENILASESSVDLDGWMSNKSYLGHAEESTFIQSLNYPS